MKNKQKIILKPVIIIIIVIGVYCYVMGLRFTPKATLQAWPVKHKEITILERYNFNAKNTFVVFKDNKDNSYGAAHLKGLNGFIYRSHFVGRGIENNIEKPIINVCILSGGGFINYIIVNNEKVRYVAMGSEYEMYSDPLNKKEITLDEVIQKEQFYDVKEIRDDDTVCFWGMLTEDEYGTKGRVLLFDENGSLISSEWLF